MDIAAKAIDVFMIAKDKNQSSKNDILSPVILPWLKKESFAIFKAI